MTTEILTGLGTIIGLVLTYAKVTNDYSKMKRENILKDIEIYENVGSAEHKERILNTIKKSTQSLYPRITVKHNWSAIIAMPIYIGCGIYFILYLKETPIFSFIALIGLFGALEILKRSTLTNFFGKEEDFYLKRAYNKSFSRTRNRAG